MFGMFLQKLRLLLKNPLTVFVYGIMTKWYIIVMVPAIVVAFWVFKGLGDAGFLQVAEEVVVRALNDTKSVARYCVPKIAHPKEFWDCLQAPPSYEATKEEKEFEKGMTDLLDFGSYDQKKDPYADE